MISEWWLGKDLEQSGRGLIPGIIPKFAWRNWGKPQKKLSQNTQFPGRDLNPEYSEY
jgi:hypothetical protein